MKKAILIFLAVSTTKMILASELDGSSDARNPKMRAIVHGRDLKKEVEVAEKDKDNAIVSFLRVLGFSEQSLGKMALNLLVYFSDLLVRKFIGDETVTNEIPQYRALVQKEGLVRGVTNLLAASSARAEAIHETLLTRTLPEDLIMSVHNRTGESTSCVQLFLCKMAPAMWTLQDTIRNEGYDFSRSIGSNVWNIVDITWNNVPDSEDVGQECEEKFLKCPLIDFTHVFS